MKLLVYSCRGFIVIITMIFLLFGVSFTGKSQCTVGYVSGNLTVNLPCTISSNVTITGDLTLNANLTVVDGITVTVTGQLNNSYSGSARTITVSGGTINTNSVNSGQNTTLSLDGVVVNVTGAYTPGYHSGLSMSGEAELHIGTYFQDNIQQNSISIDNSTLTTGTYFTLSGSTGLSLTNGSIMDIGTAMSMSGGSGKQLNVCSTCSLDADSYSSGGMFTLNIDGDMTVTNTVSLTNGSQIVNIDGTLFAGSLSSTNGKTYNIASTGLLDVTGNISTAGTHVWVIDGEVNSGNFNSTHPSTYNIKSTGELSVANDFTSSATQGWTIDGIFNADNFTSSHASTYTVGSTGQFDVADYLRFTSGTQTINQSGIFNAGAFKTSGSASFTLNPADGNFNIANAVTVSGGNFTVNGGNGDLSFGGDLNINNGNFSLYDTLSVPGTIEANGGNDIRIYPRGRLIAESDLIIHSNESLIVGTNVAPPPYADLVIKGNLISEESGDITVNQNGRVAVYGDVRNDGSGGTFLKINSGGQMYVDGNIDFSGGGDDIINNNASNPYGLYVNGTVTNSGGGSDTTDNIGNKQDLIDTNPDFNAWLGEQPNSPLPVELISFGYSFTDGYVSLFWKTAVEINNDYFSIEKSNDGVNFYEVATISGNGNSNSIRSYSWTDDSDLMELTYYRLKQTDYDGKFEYLRVLAVSPTFGSSLDVYPNPVSSGSQVFLRGSIDSQTNWSLFDLNGNEMSSGTFDRNTTISTSNFRSGIYMLKISNQQNVVSKKLIVQ
ncbi:T9SS type A sorting domain-containing protein [Reichenbachiella sp. MALMAid0571]|uniref:T9SS type A sorting domain-containing protein n=1 Tax=Reichenbachiella sp. MALMAid0571 TaxID=3143939 RepID=UPI0032DE865F